ARTDLADLALAVLGEQQRVPQERVVREHARLEVGLVEILDLHVLIAVGHEEPRERTGREAPRRRHARRILRELADVLDLLVEDLDARRDRAVEQERFGEADLVVLRTVALLRGDAERLPAAHEVRRLERELTEEA